MTLNFIQTSAFLLIGIISIVSSQSEDCLDCICATETNNGSKVSGCAAYNTATTLLCSNMPGCDRIGNTCKCGAFHISESYYTECTKYTDVPLPGGCGVDTTFIKTEEGFTSTGIVRTINGVVESTSGVIIGNGIDLGSKNEAYFTKLGVSLSLIYKLEAYFGVKGAAAQRRINKCSLTLSTSEAEYLSTKVMSYEFNIVKTEYDSVAGSGQWDLLTDAQRTVLASVLFQYGSTSRVSTFWGYATSQNWVSVQTELRNFGDNYSSRRILEADLLKNDDGTKSCKYWHVCAIDNTCARQCVKNYMKHFGQYCTGSLLSSITCEQFGRIHSGGQKGCNATATVSYGSQISTCCSNSGVSCFNIPDVPPVTVCTTEEADVVLVLDESGSISANDFLKQLDFVRDLVAKFDISSQHIRIGLMTYAATVRVRFNVGEKTTQSEVNSALDSIYQTGGGTNTFLALDSVRTTMLVSPHTRANIPKYCILVTDGKSSDASATTAAATMAHNAGIKVFAIGVGSNVNVNELIDIASKPEYVLTVESFGTLEKIASVVADRTCTEIKRTNDLDKTGISCHFCNYIKANDSTFEYNYGDESCLKTGASYVPNLQVSCKTVCYESKGTVQLNNQGTTMTIEMAAKGCSPFSSETSSMNGLCVTSADQLKILTWYSSSNVTVTGEQCFCNTELCNTGGLLSGGRMLHHSLGLILLMIAFATFYCQ